MQVTADRARGEVVLRLHPDDARDLAGLLLGSAWGVEDPEGLAAQLTASADKVGA